MVRIGMVNYINTAPLYEVWKEKIHRPDWRIIEAPPSKLNTMLAAGELDLGCVSSYEYAVHPKRYQILPRLSISANGPVGSVYLFSDVEIGDLSDKLILLSGQSETSVCLVKILLEDFHHIQPRYITGEVFGKTISEEPVSAVLAIGDEALRLKAEDRYPVRLDLGEMWYRQTGLPFVFAVYAVRREFIARDADLVAEIHVALLTCLEEGLGNLRSIAAKVAPRIPMSVNACHDYLQAMEYDLNQNKQEALQLFFSSLIARNEANSAALPLKFCKS